MSNKKIVLIVTEGETDDLFYRKIMDILKKKILGNRFCVDDLDYICIKGFGNFDSKLISLYKAHVKKICSEFNKNEDKVKAKDIEKYVFLCYDHDVFEGKKKPPIDWKKIEKELRKIKGTNVYHIVANRMIEDFILLDFDGVLRFLRISKSKINPKNYKSLEGLKKLYKLANKAYIKGEKSESLINHLDFELIESKICSQLSQLCQIVGVKCKHK